MDNRPIRIVLADDHEIFRDGFRVMCNKIPGLKLIGEAENGEELIKVVRELKPEVVVTDIKMPVMDGIEATRIINNEFPDIGIIALSMHDEEHLILDMLEAGAEGYLIKNAPKEEITAAIRSVHENENYYCSLSSAKLAELAKNSKYRTTKSIKVEFSDKEIAVIRFICQEMANKDIADQMELSKRTIEGYREKILEKIGAKNTVGLVVYAIKHKIYQMPPTVPSSFR